VKIKGDFVTNSSSTSFIISGKYDGKGLDGIKDIFNGLIQDYREKTEWDKDAERPPLIKGEMIQKTGSDTFSIMDFIPQSNEEDIPQWIKDIFINSDSEAGKKLERAGIKITNVGLKNLNE